jgi:expansin (peptidoglycan-binding protein)
LGLLFLACTSPAGSTIPLGESQDGIATWYDADGSGNCSFDPSPVDLDVAALNTPQYAGAAMCGACLQVDGPSGSVTVRVVDRCPECASGHVDLSRQAFEKIAKLGDGRVSVKWKPVSCALSGNVGYHYKDGSSEYWTAIQVRNHRLPVKQLEVRKGTEWVALPREPYNYFVAKSGVGPGPVTVRITASDGQTLEDTLTPAASDVAVVGSGQFR